MYYPDFVSKLSYLVFPFCSGHFFNDGNKRIALTLGTYFLHKNGHNWAAVMFMKRMEAIVYHIAAGNISDELFDNPARLDKMAQKSYVENLAVQKIADTIIK